MPLPQVLHVAVLRRHLSLVERLLALGIRSSVRNARSWTPLDEAIALQDTTLVRVLHMSEVAAAKADMKAKRGQLLQTMKELPDYTFKVCVYGFNLILRGKVTDTDLTCLA